MVLRNISAWGSNPEGYVLRPHRHGQFLNLGLNFHPVSVATIKTVRSTFWSDALAIFFTFIYITIAASRFYFQAFFSNVLAIYFGSILLQNCIYYFKVFCIIFITFMTR
jgi:hypothetical protein